MSKCAYTVLESECSTSTVRTVSPLFSSVYGGLRALCFFATAIC